MRGDGSGRPTAAERERFEAVVVDETTPGYVAVRALIALGDEANDRLARSTVMGREFVAGIRRRVADGKGISLFAERPNTVERVLDTATAQIVAAGRRELAIASVSAALGIPRRTLHRLYTASELIEASQRRASTIWRGRFAYRIGRSDATDVQRLFLVVDAIAKWIGSDRFQGDQILSASYGGARRDEFREHATAIERFATALAQKAQVGNARAFGIFVAVNVVGAAAWIDHREEAHALAIGFVEQLTGASRQS